MIIIENLKNIFLSRSNLYSFADGLYYRDGVFYPTFFHGSIFGDIAIEYSNGAMENVQPCNIRSMIESLYGYNISLYSKIVLIPCYSKIVRRKYPNILEDWNIEILTNWNSITQVAIVSKIGELFVRSVTGNDVLKDKDKNDYKILVDYKHLNQHRYLEAIKKGKARIV